MRALLQRIALQLSRIASPGVVVPAEAREATAKRARHTRRQERLHIIESARGRSLARGIVQSKEPLPALERRSVARIGQQIGLGRQPQQHCHAHTALVFDDGPHEEERVSRVGQFVGKSLPSVHGAERIVVRGSVFANDHSAYKLRWRLRYESVSSSVSVWLTPKPLPPCCAVAVPLPEEGCGAGPAAPPPITAVGGEPKGTGVEGTEPVYWL